MKYTIIGDLHLQGWDEDYLNAQINTIRDITKDSDNDVIFLGDIFHVPNPSAKELLAFDDLLMSLPYSYILRGNHDTLDRESTQSVVSLFQREWSDAIEAESIIQTFDTNFYALPHNYDSSKLKGQLRKIKDNLPKKFIVGHFGYKGLLSPEGYDETDITVDDFPCKTFLGHIHTYSEVGNVVVVGTPYSTSFAEGNKKNYYAVYDTETNTHEMVEIKSGPKHLILDENDLDTYDFDKNYYYLLRVVTNSNEIDQIRKKIPDWIKKVTLVPRSSDFKHNDYWDGTIKTLPSYVDDIDTDLNKGLLKKMIKTFLEPS